MSLIVPAIWYPGQSKEESDYEVGLMVQRSLAVNALLEGSLDQEQFCDLLSDQGYFVEDLLDTWGEGVPLL